MTKFTNVDELTVAGFGHEWRRFDQSTLSEQELLEHFERYFSEFPWSSLPPNAEGFDLGCGSGRWARFVAPRVRRLHCIDASADALAVAKQNLSAASQCTFDHASVDAIPLQDGSQDFGYSLGVLHHVPDTQAALASCVAKLKPGAPFLVYLYYAFDNRPTWFRALWKATDLIRFLLSRAPFRIRAAVTELIAWLIYWPLARLSSMLARAGMNVEKIPLSFYRNASLYTMRTDALDRFGTRLERRFTKAEIVSMMTAAGLADVRVRAGAPYWCAVGVRIDSRRP